MKARQLSLLMVFALTASCSDAGGPAAPDSGSPAMSPMDHMSAAVTATAAATPFTVRGTLDPYRIVQQPDFMIQSKERSDIVIQQSVFVPGAGMWHTHPGPSFVYVVDGQIKLERYTREDGCTETPVYGPGQVYFEVADQVHRAVVVSATDAVLLVTRFNIPVGQPITIPAADPGC